jgi:hypothetical protein
MKNIIPLLFTLMIGHQAISQESGLQITNYAQEKVIFMKENQRVKIQTIEGQKITGKFSIQDLNTILVGDATIQLSEIESIKRNPFVTSVLVGSSLIYLGSVTIGLAAIAGVFADSNAFLVAIPGAALIYAGIKSPNFYKKYEKVDWGYQLIPAK